MDNAFYNNRTGGLGWLSGTSVTYICEKGYSSIMEGDMKLKCVDGDWVGIFKDFECKGKGWILSISSSLRFRH